MHCIMGWDEDLNKIVVVSTFKDYKMNEVPTSCHLQTYTMWILMIPITRKQDLVILISDGKQLFGEKIALTNGRDGDGNKLEANRLFTLSLKPPTSSGGYGLRCSQVTSSHINEHKKPKHLGNETHWIGCKLATSLFHPPS